MLIMSEKKSSKLTFENRLIRFLVFDLLIGFELADIDMPAKLAAVSGFVALYLLLTSLVGRCPIEWLVVKYILRKE